MLLFSPSFINSSDGFNISFKLCGAFSIVKEKPSIVYPIFLNHFFGNGNWLSSGLNEKDQHDLTPRIYVLHKITIALKFMSYINQKLRPS